MKHNVIGILVRKAFNIKIHSYRLQTLKQYIHFQELFCRSSCPEVFCKKGVLKNFKKFAGKHLCTCTFIKKETLTQMFSCEFCEIFKNTIFYKTPLVTASVFDPLVPGVYYKKVSNSALRKIPKLNLISSCENFVERHSFSSVSGESFETLRKLCLSTKFLHQDMR